MILTSSSASVAVKIDIGRYFSHTRDVPNPERNSAQFRSDLDHERF
jgi:hypothetical protein